jgi:hypothetical protein
MAAFPSTLGGMAMLLGMTWALFVAGVGLGVWMMLCKRPRWGASLVALNLLPFVMTGGLLISLNVFRFDGGPHGGALGDFVNQLFWLTLVGPPVTLVSAVAALTLYCLRAFREDAAHA